MATGSNRFYYSDKYFDTDYEYRHVVLPKDMASRIPKNRLMSEQEWRGLGVQQSLGWEHYMIHKPEPHILLFRRPLTDDVKEDKQREKEEQEFPNGREIMIEGKRVGIMENGGIVPASDYEMARTRTLTNS